MEKIKIYSPDQIEYTNLWLFVDEANQLLKPTPFALSLEETYFDYGQHWLYTAPITTNLLKNDTWQSLCPRDYTEIVDAKDKEEIKALAKKYVDNLLASELGQSTGEDWLIAAKKTAISDAQDFLDNLRDYAEEQNLEADWYIEEVIKNVHKLKHNKE